MIYGCNERCTFCIVPTTRGVEQSRPIKSIVEEVKDLVAKGYKEVTLLGQNIDAYGRDMIPKQKFSDLISIVGNIPGKQGSFCIQLMTCLCHSSHEEFLSHHFRLATVAFCDQPSSIHVPRSCRCGGGHTNRLRILSHPLPKWIQ